MMVTFSRRGPLGVIHSLESDYTKNLRVLTEPYDKCTAGGVVEALDSQELRAFITRLLAIAVLPLQTGRHPVIEDQDRH